jgi:hypothetical protein
LYAATIVIGVDHLRRRGGRFDSASGIDIHIRAYPTCRNPVGINGAAPQRVALAFC